MLGTVKDIGLLVTTINTLDNVRTIVGNNKIFSDNIQNFSTNPYRRVDLKAQLNHSVDHDAAVRLLKERVAKIPNVNPLLNRTLRSWNSISRDPYWPCDRTVTTMTIGRCTSIQTALSAKCSGSPASRFRSSMWWCERYSGIRRFPGGQAYWIRFFYSGRRRERRTRERSLWPETDNHASCETVSVTPSCAGVNRDLGSQVVAGRGRSEFVGLGHRASDSTLLSVRAGGRELLKH